MTVGEQQPAWVQILVFAINQALGNNGATILGVDTGEKTSASISDLAAAIKTGAAKTLFILGANPAYNAPADLDFSGLLKKVPQTVHLGLFEDETAKLCRWHVPGAHYLEAWSDVCAYDGTYSAVQPMILPLWNGISELEIFAQLAGRQRPQGPELIRETLTQRFEADAEKWNSVLRVGFAPGSEWPEVPLSFNAGQAAAEMKDVKPAGTGWSWFSSKAAAWTMAAMQTTHGFRKLRTSKRRSPGTMSPSSAQPLQRNSASRPTILARSTRLRRSWATTSILTSSLT